MAFDIVLWLHIALGTLALAAGATALGARKGGRLHRGAGRVFVPSLAASLVTAVVLSVWHPNVFLFAIALFSGYLLFSGWRAARRRDAGAGLDRAAAWAMLLTGGLMAVGGLIGFGPGDYRAWVLLVFGLLGAGFAGQDLRRLRAAGGARAGREGAGRIARHVSRIGGAFIATVTAVAVVNLTMLPDLATWLGPTVLLSPVLAWHIARLQRGRGTLARERPGI